jgi:hypothetical protein
MNIKRENFLGNFWKQYKEHHQGQFWKAFWRIIERTIMKINILSSTFTLYLQERNVAKHYKSFTKCNIPIMERN